MLGPVWVSILVSDFTNTASLDERKDPVIIWFLNASMLEPRQAVPSPSTQWERYPWKSLS
jgi:hypothetical protein